MSLEVAAPTKAAAEHAIYRSRLLSSFPQIAGLPGVAAGLAAGASTDPFSPKKVKQVKMCFSKYNITTGVPVTGATIMGYPCDAQDQALVRAGCVWSVGVESGSEARGTRRGGRFALVQ